MISRNRIIIFLFIMFAISMLYAHPPDEVLFEPRTKTAELWCDNTEIIDGIVDFQSISNESTDNTGGQKNPRYATECDPEESRRDLDIAKAFQINEALTKKVTLIRDYVRHWRRVHQREFERAEFMLNASNYLIVAIIALYFCFFFQIKSSENDKKTASQKSIIEYIKALGVSPSLIFMLAAFISIIQSLGFHTKYSAYMWSTNNLYALEASIDSEINSIIHMKQYTINNSRKLDERIKSWTELYREILDEFSEKYSEGITPISVSSFKFS